MTNSLLKERVAQLERARAADPVSSGSPVTLVIRDAGRTKRLRSFEAIVSLKRQGVALLKAKRLIEQVMAQGEATVFVPNAAPLEELASEFAGYGFTVHAVAATPIDVRGLRERLGLTQEQFALRYGLELDAIRNWEHGRRQPDTAARSYLRVIDRMPEETRAALLDPVGR